jgi:hypothetical protein
MQYLLPGESGQLERHLAASASLRSGGCSKDHNAGLELETAPTE